MIFDQKIKKDNDTFQKMLEGFKFLKVPVELELELQISSEYSNSLHYTVRCQFWKRY